MAHGLGHVVVAEGVEDYDQLEHIKRLGCDSVQGFLFSKPLPIGELVSGFSLPVSAAC
ncbi:EAL domain-containing protein [Rhizobium sp. AAP43]|uniref:EAL domain-containing protein n=1 Tax=Rhizobium sp. AAP43 TaxID=1523420 RepID=UPI0009EB7E14